MEDLKHKMDDLTNIDRHIVDQLSSFGILINNFQTTFQSIVLTLSNTVTRLSTEVEYLREDIKNTENMKKDIVELQKQYAQNKGSWLALVSMGTSGVAIAGMIVSLVAIFAKHIGS